MCDKRDFHYNIKENLLVFFAHDDISFSCDCDYDRYKWMKFLKCESWSEESEWSYNTK